jgi:hypothetical protein
LLLTVWFIAKALGGIAAEGRGNNCSQYRYTHHTWLPFVALRRGDWESYRFSPLGKVARHNALSQGKVALQIQYHYKTRDLKR